ncbi:hypothetical protein BN2127_JRS1_03898 [Bacillus cereus]|nr:hypothetical protein BN2127_JRS1_03898 [Bacillus cereus]
MINLNDLEPGIRALVAQFIETCRTSAKQQSFYERLQGYLNTINFAGEAVPVWNIFDQTVDGCIITTKPWIIEEDCRYIRLYIDAYNYLISYTDKKRGYF